MALHINLYHEIQTQDQLRRRDPLKLGLIGLSFVALLFAGYYFYRMNDARLTSAEAREVAAEWQRLEPLEAEARTKEAELTAKITTTDAVVSRINNRLLWAPLLEMLHSVVTPDVQVTALLGDAGNESAPRITINVSGVSSGPEPRKTAEDLRTAFFNELAKRFQSVESNFRSLEDSPEQVQLNGQPMPTANFALQFLMDRTTSTDGDPAQATTAAQ